MSHTDDSPEDAASDLRSRVVREHGLLVVKRSEFRDLVRRQRFRPSPEGTGAGAPALRSLLAAVDLGALPIGRESETLTGRTAPLYSDGVFCELTSLSHDDNVAIFDKRSALGRVLMLAGDPGRDYQAVAQTLETSFPLGDDSTAEGIRAAAHRNGGIVVVRRDTLLASLTVADHQVEAVMSALLAAELVPLPIQSVSFPHPGAVPDIGALRHGA